MRELRVRARGRRPRRRILGRGRLRGGTGPRSSTSCEATPLPPGDVVVGGLHPVEAGQPVEVLAGSSGLGDSFCSLLRVGMRPAGAVPARGCPSTRPVGQLVAQLVRGLLDQEEGSSGGVVPPVGGSRSEVRPWLPDRRARRRRRPRPARPAPRPSSCGRSSVRRWPRSQRGRRRRSGRSAIRGAAARPLRLVVLLTGGRTTGARQAQPEQVPGPPPTPAGGRHATDAGRRCRNRPLYARGGGGRNDTGSGARHARAPDGAAFDAPGGPGRDPGGPDPDAGGPDPRQRCAQDPARGPRRLDAVRPAARRAGPRPGSSRSRRGASPSSSRRARIRC